RCLCLLPNFRLRQCSIAVALGPRLSAYRLRNPLIARQLLAGLLCIRALYNHPTEALRLDPRLSAARRGFPGLLRFPEDHVPEQLRVGDGLAVPGIVEIDNQLLRRMLDDGLCPGC